MKLKLIILLFTISISLFAQEQKVILVIVDGARYSETLGDTLNWFFPRTRAISNQGVVVDSFMNDGITVTERAVPAIWSGSWIQPKDTVINGKSTQYALVPTLWEYYRKAKNADSTQALYVMKYLSSPWLSSYLPDYGPSYWPYYILQGSSDQDVWVNAKAKLTQYKPQLSVLYFSDVDHYGHLGVWSDYTKAVVKADSILEALWNFVQSNPDFKDKTNIIVTNDHGRHLTGTSTGFVGHGDNCWGCRHIMLMGLGPAFKTGVHINKRFTTPDIVPTIGAILNFPTPSVSGAPMYDILSATSVEDKSSEEKKSTRLLQNYPNPFGKSTTVCFSVANEEKVEFSIYSITGELVKEIPGQVFNAGTHTIDLAMKDLSRGVYILKLKTNSTIDSKKIVKGY